MVAGSYRCDNFVIRICDGKYFLRKQISFCNSDFFEAGLSNLTMDNVFDACSHVAFT